MQGEELIEAIKSGNRAEAILLIQSDVDNTTYCDYVSYVSVYTFFFTLHALMFKLSKK